MHGSGRCAHIRNSPAADDLPPVMETPEAKLRVWGGMSQLKVRSWRIGAAMMPAQAARMSDSATCESALSAT